jgi:hypothetical protein
MSRRVAGWVAAIAMSAAVAGCQKLPPKLNVVGKVPLQKAAYVDAIPAEYGDLVGVVQDASVPSGVRLLFVRPDKSITVVFFDYYKGTIGTDIFVVPRR